MKKLYNSKGPKRVHPSPPSPSPSPHLLSSLPTALLALASTLSPQEQEVLSYLLDSEKLKENQPKNKNKNKNKKKKDKDDNNYNHAPDLACSCFGCYKSFWARWDASPNRHVIHLILDAFEETLDSKEANRKKKRGLKSKKIDFDEVLVKEVSAHEEKVDDDDAHDDGYGHDGNDDDDDGYDGDDGHGDGDEEEEDEEEKSSVRRFVSWVFGMNN